MSGFEKILIANRGEIATRVIRTAQAMGYRTVAVYSEADADAPHVLMADEAVPIGPAPVGESYLVAEKLIEAARLSGADAVHPGYGFLSENADFARACEAAGIAFIGPSPEAIELMGSKRLSKLAMIDAGVPCIPGYQGSDQSDFTLLAEAERIGFPLMIKASAGGGGRGMRLAEGPDGLEGLLASARSEAQSAFGSGELILERAVINPRHIEIQVFADTHGNAVYLGERDCSVQRRHQKVVEEAPSPFVSPELRRAMGEAAVNAARACNYRGAGTVEFLVDDDGAFYFLEMNTRLQVEHPVTELITGQDLVEWQLREAAGEALPLSQEDISLDGWAMEVRLYAEDPRHAFQPQTGTILRWQVPEGPGLRVDSGIREGLEVSPFYDPMLAKIIASGRNRDEARRRLARAVEDCTLLGVTSNKHFLAAILRYPVFAEGGATTGFLTEHFAEDATMQPAALTAREKAMAAVLLHEARAADHTMGNWRSAAQAPWHYRIASEIETFELSLTIEAAGYRVICDGEEQVIKVEGVRDGLYDFIIGGLRQRCRYLLLDGALWLDGISGSTCLRDITHAPVSSASEAGNGRLTAPMDGALVGLLAEPGQVVAKGEILAVLEAMKMEHQLAAYTDGTVQSVPVIAGAQVKKGQLLVEVIPAVAEDG